MVCYHTIVRLFSDKIIYPMIKSSVAMSPHCEWETELQSQPQCLDNGGKKNNSKEVTKEMPELDGKIKELFKYYPCLCNSFPLQAKLLLGFVHLCISLAALGKIKHGTHPC